MDGAGKHVMLDDPLDIAAAEGLKTRFSEAVAASGDPVLNGSAVARLTTPCLQLFVSLARSLEAQGRTFSIEAPSEAMRQAFVDAGLAHEFNQWSGNHG